MKKIKAEKIKKSLGNLGTNPEQNKTWFSNFQNLEASLANFIFKLLKNP
jgi:hypothetical protein